MSAAERKTDPQSPRDGMISRFVKNIFLTKGHIASAEKLSEHFHLVSLKGEELKNALDARRQDPDQHGHRFQHQNLHPDFLGR
jgi:hypothetical protein